MITTKEKKNIGKSSRKNKKHNQRRKLGNSLKVKIFLWSKQKAKNMATENLKMGVEKHNILDKLKKNEGQDKTISDRPSVTNNSKGNPKDNVMHKVMLAPIRMDSGNTPCKEGQMTVDLGFVEVVDDTGKHNKHGSDIQRGKALV